jgi:hypothetical protein
VSSKVGIFGKCRAVFYVWLHGTVEWACEYFERCVETCVYCGGELICDGPLIGYFRHYTLWVSAVGSWVVSLHEKCKISNEVG